jgi:hypothetical protein
MNDEGRRGGLGAPRDAVWVALTSRGASARPGASTKERRAPCARALSRGAVLPLRRRARLGEVEAAVIASRSFRVDVPRHMILRHGFAPLDSSERPRALGDIDAKSTSPSAIEGNGLLQHLFEIHLPAVRRRNPRCGFGEGFASRFDHESHLGLGCRVEVLDDIQSEAPDAIGAATHRQVGNSVTTSLTSLGCCVAEDPDLTAFFEVSGHEAS